MLLEVGIRNFKAFGDVEQKAPMSKITLIYGPNSGGKSSIIQAILMLKQSALEAGNASTIWGLVTRGEYIDLGSYPALLHRHNLDNQLALSLKFDSRGNHLNVRLAFDSVSDFDERGDEQLEDSGILTTATYEVTRDGQRLISTELTNDIGSWWHASVSTPDVTYHTKILDFAHDRQFVPQLKLLEIEKLLERDEPLLPEREQGLVRERGRERVLETNNTLRQYEELEQLSEQQLNELFPLDRDLPRARANARALARDPEEVLLQSIDERLNWEEILELKNIPSSFSAQLSAVRYLGPLRSYPERLYKIPGVDTFFSGLRGEFTHHRLYYQPGLIRLVNNWFHEFRIPYQMAIHKVGDIAVSGEHVAVVLVERGSGTAVTLPDVGFGINQILPVIVEGVDFFTGVEGRILCVEQPEIHLHPKLQANLADLFIETISGRSEKQWIIETHSELIILRIQRGIREGKLKHSDVSVLYVDPNASDTEGSAITQLRLDENGDFIDQWPGGFFEEGFEELMA